MIPLCPKSGSRGEIRGASFQQLAEYEVDDIRRCSAQPLAFTTNSPLVLRLLDPRRLRAQPFAHLF
jgi:hypothetical protein